jgi:hypothetical protein
MFLRLVYIATTTVKMSRADSSSRHPEDLKIVNTVAARPAKGVFVSDGLFRLIGNDFRVVGRVRLLGKIEKSFLTKNEIRADVTMDELQRRWRTNDRTWINDGRRFSDEIDVPNLGAALPGLMDMVSDHVCENHRGGVESVLKAAFECIGSGKRVAGDGMGVFAIQKVVEDTHVEKQFRSERAEINESWVVAAFHIEPARANTLWSYIYSGWGKDVVRITFVGARIRELQVKL